MAQYPGHGNYQNQKNYKNQTHHNRNHPGGGSSEPPEPHLVQYFDANENLKSELLDRQAENIARELKLGGISPTQLRRFYADVMNLRQRLAIKVGSGQTQDDAFTVLQADFKMLKAKAFYAHGRDKKTFPREMLQFLVNHVFSVKNAADFEAFCKHFQAVVAFHKFYDKEDKT